MISTLAVPDTVAVEPTFVAFLYSTHKHKSMACRAILSKFFEEQRTLNHPQYLSGLSHALFQNTFLELAVYDFEFNLNFASVFFKAYEYSGVCNLSFLKNIQVRINSKTVNKESRMITLE